MYLVVKTLKVPKENSQSVADRFNFGEIYRNFSGFVKEEVGIHSNGSEDIVFVLDYWESKEAFQKWHLSEEHRNLHRNRQKPDYPVEVKHYTMDLIKQP